MFGTLKTNDLEAARDVVSSGYSAVPTDIYTGIVKMAYATTSSGGALGVVLQVYLEETGKDYNETLYVSSKDGKNYSIDKDSGKKRPLPGFTIINDLCMVTAEMELSAIETETKVVPVYNYDLKKQVPTEVPVLTELLNQKIYLAIFQKEENKKVKNDKGDYIPTAETKTVNSIEKIMQHPSKLTVREAMADTESTYFDSWLEANKGKVLDKRTIKDGTTSTGNTTSQAAKSAPTKTSLFGKK